MSFISLCDLKKGDSLVIKEIKTGEKLRQRLLDIGIIPGTKAKCVRISPFGDPKAFLVRGTVIALRNYDSAKVLGVKE